MDFKNTFSKIKKTAMDTATTVAQSAKEGSTVIAKKSGELIEISKLTLSMNSEESKIKDIYCEIGKNVYEKHQQGLYIDPELVQYCNDVVKLKETVKELQEKINELKMGTKIDSVEFQEVPYEDVNPENKQD